MFFGISLAVISIGLIFMGLNQVKGKGILNFGLDFVGGTSTTVEFDVDYTIEEIEANIIPKVAEIIDSNNIQANKMETTTQMKNY